MSTLDLLNAIVDKNSTEIFETFEQEMSARILDRLDDRRVEVAQSLFKESLDEAVGEKPLSYKDKMVALYKAQKASGSDTGAPTRKPVRAGAAARTPSKSPIISSDSTKKSSVDQSASTKEFSASKVEGHADDNNHIITQLRGMLDFPGKDGTVTFSNGEKGPVSYIHAQAISTFHDTIEKPNDKLAVARLVGRSPKHLASFGERAADILKQYNNLKEDLVSEETPVSGLSMIQGLGFKNAKARDPKPRPTEELTPDEQAKRKQSQENLRLHQINIARANFNKYDR